jgi:hypothetical protein
LGRSLHTYSFKYPKFYDTGKFKYDKLLAELFGEGRADTSATGALSYLSDEFQFTGMNP